MEAKLFEVRDRATFLPVIAVRMQPEMPRQPVSQEDVERYEAEFYLLRRVGYSMDHNHFSIAVGRAAADGTPVNCDPYAWRDRTMQAAHLHIEVHWDSLKTGDVIDVEYLLDESAKPKVSERLE